MITTEQLNRFNSKDFSRLIVTQLGEAFSEDSKRRASAFSSLGIDYLQLDTPVDVLERLHGVLTIEARDQLEQAVLDSLREIDLRRYPEAVFACLLDTVGRLQIDKGLPDLMDSLLSRGGWLKVYPSLSYSII
jgi:hypothetical protein